jgi:signal transduction histidine kinase
MWQKELRLFDKAEFGVVGINRNGAIGYTNKWICKLLRRQIKNGTSFREFIKDSENLEAFDQEIERRLAGKSGHYLLTLDAKGQPAKVQVFGTPVRDANGKVVAAIAFISNASTESLRDSILNVGISNAHPLDSLDKLRRLLEPSFPFDMLTVALYDDNMKYSRVLYTYFKEAPGDPRRWDKHWVKLTDGMVRWMQHMASSGLAVEDIEDFIEKHPVFRELKDDPMLKALLESGLKSSATVMIKEGRNIVASVSLLSKQRAEYDDNVVQELNDLPIDRCVLAAANTIRNSDLAFRYRLVRRLARCDSIGDLTKRTVDMLRRQYKLARVALYSVDWQQQAMCLRAETRIDSTDYPAAAASLPSSEGAFAEVVNTDEPVYLKTLPKDDPLTASLGEKEKSAFLWPVSYEHGEGQSQVRWVFCAVDEQPDAFSPIERRGLIGVASDIGGLLEWLTELHFVGSTFETASDAIVVVDGNHEVRRVNPAATRLFRDNKALSTFFANPADAEPFMGSGNHKGEARLVDCDNVEFHAMVSCRTLPAAIGGKVFTFEDLTNIKRLEDLGFLGQMAAEISAQMQTPLTLASSWVQRITSLASSGDKEAKRHITDLAERTDLQLRRIQSCIDRIALYNSSGEFKAHTPIPVSLDSELRRIITDLPEYERNRIRLNTSRSGVRINANPNHLGFVLDTLLAYFLRDLPGDDKVTVTTGKDDGHGWFECRVRQRKTQSAMEAADAAALPLSQELGLVEKGLRRILEGYDGTLEATGGRGANRRVSCVHVELPLS